MQKDDHVVTEDILFISVMQKILNGGVLLTRVYAHDFALKLGCKVLRA